MKPKVRRHRILVVGGTGMLAPLCHSAKAYDLIVAARFVSNHDKVAQLAKTTLCIPLDYTKKQSSEAFLRAFRQWTNLSCCVIWVHSHAHDFSFELINSASLQQFSLKPGTKAA